MLGLSLPHLIVLALVVVLLFGRGKVADLMGEFGKGVKSFKDGIADETTSRPVTPPPVQLTAQPPAANAPATPVADPTLTPAPLVEHPVQR